MKKKLSNLLGREFRFLARPLNLWSRLLLLLAAAAIVAALFFPLWRMHLVAPNIRTDSICSSTATKSSAAD